MNRIKSRIMIILLLSAAYLAISCDRSKTVIIFSDPNGAEIFVDGKSTNSITPDTIELDRNTLRISLSHPDYHHYSQDISSFEENVATVNATLKPWFIGDNKKPPKIWIAEIYEANTAINGSNTIVRGGVENIDPRDVQVVLWAKKDRWYVQPLIDLPFTKVHEDGSWKNSVKDYDSVVALLVDSSYDPWTMGSGRVNPHPSILAVGKWKKEDYKITNVDLRMSLRPKYEVSITSSPNGANIFLRRPYMLDIEDTKHVTPYTSIFLNGTYDIILKYDGYRDSAWVESLYGGNYKKHFHIELEQAN